MKKITLIVPIQSIDHRVEFVDGNPAFRFEGGEWVFSVPFNTPFEVQFQPVTRPEIVQTASAIPAILLSLLLLSLMFLGGR